MEIAKQFLVPKQLEATGLNGQEHQFTDDAHHAIIRAYTREAGVRNLEREIGIVCRKVARKVVRRKARVTIDHHRGKTSRIPRRPLKFRDTLAHEKSEVGLVTGLA